MSEFKNMKFRVKDAAHSEQIQEALFALGYVWGRGETNVQLTNGPYLFASTHGQITYDSREETYECSYKVEATLEDILPSSNQQIREEIIKATTVLNKYDIGCYSKAMTDHGRGYWIGCKLTTTLDDLLDTEFPLETPEQKELSEVEEQMRKLADRLAELKGEVVFP